MSKSFTNSLAYTACHEIEYIYPNSMYEQWLFPPRSSILIEKHIRNLCSAYAITVSIFLMQMRVILLCTQVCFIIQNLSLNPYEEKRETVICFIWFPPKKQNWIPKKTHSIYRPIKPNTVEYIWKHGAHLNHVTSESLWEAFFKCQDK